MTPRYMTPRYATRDDLVQWFGSVPATMRALVIGGGGDVKAIAGIAMVAGQMQAFSAYKAEMRGRSVALARLAVAFGALLRSVNGPVLALCSAEESTAPGLLSHLGFVPVSEKVWRHG